MITRREAREIVIWVLEEIKRGGIRYLTDGRIDFNKDTLGTISSGQLGSGEIFDAHINDNADIKGTKVREATISERGTVELAEDLEAASGKAVQGDDSRLHESAPAAATEHDARYYTEAELDGGQLDDRYYTESELGSNIVGSGASLIGISDPSGYFTGTDVQAALYELFVGAVSTFLELLDTPSSYANRFAQVPTINNDEAGLEWRPVDYYDGGLIVNWHVPTAMYRFPLTITPDLITSTLTHFPVLIHLSSSSGVTGVDARLVFDEIGANYKKLSVYTSDGLQLYVEIDRWDATNREGWIWVSNSEWQISDVVGARLYLYYSADMDDNEDYVGLVGSTPGKKVWDDYYLLVDHMTDNPDVSHTKDSAANGHSGNKGDPNKPQEVPSTLGYRQDFDGGAEEIDYVHHATLNATPKVTIEMVAEFKTVPFNGKSLLEKGGQGGNDTNFAFYTDATTNLYFGAGLGGVWTTEKIIEDIAQDTKYYIVAQYDGINFIGYKDGVVGLTVPNVGAIATNVQDIRVFAPSNHLDGYCDELRLSNTNRVVGWIEATNYAVTDSLLTFLDKEDNPYQGAVIVRRGEEAVDAESATMHNILDGGDADGYRDIYGDPKLRLGSRQNILLGNYLEVEEDGFVEQHGEALSWEDLRTPVNMLKFSDTKPPIWTSYKGSYVAAFEDQAVNYQSIYWVWQLPHSYKLGTDLYPHIHTVPEDDTSGNVYWQFTYSIAKKDGIFPNPTSVYGIAAMPAVADYHKFDYLAVISGAIIPSDSVDLSTIILCGLHRRSDDPLDTFGGKSVYLLEVDLHYQQDTAGSRQELTK
jgi:hypothetical protein